MKVYTVRKEFTIHGKKVHVGEILVEYLDGLMLGEEDDMVDVNTTTMDWLRGHGYIERKNK